ncbi:MAG: hypothetical protein RIB98_08400 [Acidimicrobiales bacterium]
MPSLSPATRIRLWWLGAFVVVAAFVVGGGVYVADSFVEDPDPVVVVTAPAALAMVDPSLQLDTAPARTIDPYRGYGTWVDVFDFDPAYNPPTVTAADLPEMADLGVRTLYLQGARLDDRTPDGLVDPWLLAEMLLASHREGVEVVGWYLPRFEASTEDLDRLVAMSEFEVLGHRFDGIAVDIEWIGPDLEGNPIDDETRSSRLVDLTVGLGAAVGPDPVGAIVPPPVQTEVINTSFWPGFPWTEIAEVYDVWLPMSYWSFRSDASGYGEGYTYHEESTRRLRTNVGDPDALVHGIGGIGGLDGVDDPPDPPEPLATVDEIERFVDALADTASIGGSIYDWNTLEPAVRVRLSELFPG